MFIYPKTLQKKLKHTHNFKTICLFSTSIQIQQVSKQLVFMSTNWFGKFLLRDDVVLWQN